ncbi:MAG: molybdopterin-dependent oxidoreductase [Acidobacteria bacterium]|nr:molybdopterin-dependent oxidoreductase [Acidobacteriota bacterium]
MSMTRRDLFHLAGTGAGLAAGKKLFGFTDYFAPAAAASGTANTLITACGICSPSCGIQATVQDSAIRFLQGLPGDQSGRGKLCGKGASGAQFAYDPDRLKYPMKRTNPLKGLDLDPGWVRISWQEALDTIAANLKGALDKNGPESLLFVTGAAPDIWARFMNSIGVVNRIDHLDECFLSDRIVQKYTTGGKTWCNDFANSKYILLFGWDILAKTKLTYSQGIVDARDNGAKIVVFNPQYSATAKFADEWYPIKPGSDLAVALAMINVIVSENLFNLDFVNNYTNFTDFAPAIRAHFAQYTPEWAEQQSEVPADAIRRIAREFSSRGPGIVPAHKKTLCANYQNGTQLVHAISILNILAGTIDRPGGRYFPRSVTIPGVDAVYPPPAYPPKTGRRVDGKDKLPFVLEDGSGLFSTLSDGMLKQYPGMIKACFINAYTALGFPRPARVFDALSTVPFVAVMDTLPTDTVSYADIVLPSATYLESNDLVTRDYKALFPQVVVRQALIPPMFETKSIGYVALELGKRLAPGYFKDANGDYINLNTLLDEKTKRAGLGNTFDEFRQKGIYSKDQTFVPRTTFSVPGTTKCQIYVPQFTKGAEPLPSWRPKRDLPSVDYPYYYLTFIPAVHRRNSTENNPFLHEIFPTNAAMLNTALAAKLKVKEGQSVRITSRAGSIVLPAHLTETLRPDAVMVAHGFGHRSKMLSLAGGQGARDGDIIPDQSADDMVQALNYGGAACIMDAVVQIEAL